MLIKKGDTVRVVTGKDQGKTGKVLTVYPRAFRVSVEGVNEYRKRLRPKRANQKGEVVTVVRPLHASNVGLLCPSCKRAVRVGIRRNGNAGVRYCKKCKADL